MADKTLTLTIAERHDEPGNIVRLRLVDAGGAVLPAFEAGAHLDLHLRDGSTDLWRQYSLCSDPAETGFYEIGVLLDPKTRGGSAAVHRLAVPGATFEVEGPRNHFPLSEEATTTVLLGGGIGVTPMLAMARRLHAIGRDFVLHYCTRGETVTAFRAMIAAEPWAKNVAFHFDDQSPEQRLDPTRDLPAPSSGTHIYVCGPQGFMDWLIGAAEAAGHASANVHREYFSADVDTTGDSFEVEAQRSGITVNVGPDDTIAKALARAGVKIEVKCEEGVCGTCVTDVLEGMPDHRDKFLTDEEREEGTMICACCSRACSSKLVLDI
ncbi:MULTISPECIES: PDR/VanB family oxidoreductase [Alphaproteobacteria]|uniref:Vanillate O-demethylase oxidoreductase n=2 Tax=Alphaproteobacteria TaxID=28211 RepID=A0A512HH36_9HYPH|nr:MULTISPECIES: PDR/VanB family oxidoreductase [Alphaproteobacteria]GEO84751.1 vanillate O-demethylase oxidoreductase [Ciceribacter naphthalenivorans]GLR20628.1 vanillate O-demethylase oxidoreductase [Ciceribacter naphthalenivorans]GLT03484.1 vanillate O-demethylase oxidoreductase [Sphingomonas psychrolutea]